MPDCGQRDFRVNAKGWLDWRGVANLRAGSKQPLLLGVCRSKVLLQPASLLRLTTAEARQLANFSLPQTGCSGDKIALNQVARQTVARV